MTRKTQVVVTAAAALTGLAVLTALWLTHGSNPPVDDTPSQPPRTHTATPDSSKDAPVDPSVMAEVREAYRKSLNEGAPPGMLELMGGSGSGKSASNDLPPLPMPDPNVTPVKYSSGPSPDLPPLPSEEATRPELLPPPVESPALGKKSPEAPASDLPPLPPLPSVKAPH